MIQHIVRVGNFAFLVADDGKPQLTSGDVIDILGFLSATLRVRHLPSLLSELAYLNPSAVAFDCVG